MQANRFWLIPLTLCLSLVACFSDDSAIPWNGPFNAEVMTGIYRKHTTADRSEEVLAFFDDGTGIHLSRAKSMVWNIRLITWTIDPSARQATVVGMKDPYLGHEKEAILVPTPWKDGFGLTYTFTEHTFIYEKINDGDTTPFRVHLSDEATTASSPIARLTLKEMRDRFFKE